MSSALDLTDDPLDDDALVAATRTGALPGARLRDELMSRERLTAAAATVGAARDPREAWERLGGAPGPDGARRLFHIRPGSTAGVSRRLADDMRAGALRVALCPSPGVPPAPCIAHPPSVRDAIVFAALAPVLDAVEALLARATRALDALGCGTHALSRIAARDAGRWLVWSTLHADRPDVVCRTTRLLVVHLLAQHSDGRWWHATEPGAPLSAVPQRHYGEWSQSCVIAAGALAWRSAARAGLLVAATAASRGHRLVVRTDAVGRPYAELDSPFEPLLQLRRLGFLLHGYSASAISARFRVEHGDVMCFARRR